MALLIEPGRLTKRLTIEEATETNTGGDVTQAWSEIAKRWGEPVSQSAREFYTAKAVHADATHVWRIRYYEGLSPKHRIVWNSRTFNIVSIENVGERNEEMLVTAKEVVT